MPKVQKGTPLGERVSLSHRHWQKTPYPAEKRETGPAPGPVPTQTGIRGLADIPKSTEPESIRRPTKLSIEQLTRATPNSAGLDISTNQRVILTPQMGVQTISTGIYGPLPLSCVDMLLGRSSTALKGLFIIPGVIDSDYTGEIKILAHSPQGITVVPEGARIAQLLLLPLFKTNNPVLQLARTGGLESTGTAAFVVATLTNRPMRTLIVQGKQMLGILDTGADVSVISAGSWPHTWPLDRPSTTIQGVEGISQPWRSSPFLQWEDEEGATGQFQPYVMEHLPVHLWGRDVLNKLNLVLTNEQHFCSGPLKGDTYPRKKNSVEG